MSSKQLYILNVAAEEQTIRFWNVSCGHWNRDGAVTEPERSRNVAQPNAVYIRSYAAQKLEMGGQQRSLTSEPTISFNDKVTKVMCPILFHKSLTCSVSNQICFWQTEGSQSNLGLHDKSLQHRGLM